MHSIQIYLAKYLKITLKSKILMKTSARTSTYCKQNGQFSSLNKLSIENLDLNDKRVLIR